MSDKTSRKYLIILLFVGAFLFFYNLGVIPLLDPDEPRYAETAREMLESKNFLIPHFNYEPRLNKPPLEYWVIALSYRAFGINEFAARFPSAIFGLFGILVVYFLGCRIYLSKLTGFLAGLILAVSWEYLLIAHLATIDMMLCFFMLISIIFFVKFLEERNKLCIYGLWMSLGLAFLSKGPVGLLPLIIFIVYILTEGKRDEFKDLFFIPAIFVFLIIGLFWYIIVLMKLGLAEGLALFREETVERFTAGYVHGEPFYYFIPVTLAGFMPWTIFLPWIKPEFKKNRLALVWIAVVFLFFTLSKSKIPTYILVLFPALSLILADFWQGVFTEKIQKAGFKITVSLAFFLLIVAFSFLWARNFILKSYSIELNHKLLGAYIITAGIILVALTSAFRRKMNLAFSFIVFFSCIMLILFYGVFARELANVRSIKNLISPVLNKISPEDRFCAYKIKKQSLVFYLRRRVYFSEDSLRDFLGQKGGKSFLILKEKEFKQLKDKYNLCIENKHRDIILASFIP